MLPAAAARKKDRHRNLDSLSCLTRVQKGFVCSVLLDISSSAAHSLARSRSLCLPLPFHELGKAAAAAATCIAVSQAGRAGGRSSKRATDVQAASAGSIYGIGERTRGGRVKKESSGNGDGSGGARGGQK